MSRDLIEAIRAIAETDSLSEYESVVCKASQIDLTENTCTCSPVDGTPKLFGIVLSVDKSKGFLLIPKDDSLVVVTMTSETTGFVSMVSDVDQVYIAGDANGGLVKIDNLKSQYDANVAAIKTAVSTALGIVDAQLMALGQAGGSASSFSGLAANILSLNKTPLENTKVKHGNG